MALYENTIRLKGFAGKNAQSKSSTDNPIVVFSLATKSRCKDKQSGGWGSRTEWHQVICFGDVARSAQGLQKGDYVEVQGELRSSEYSAPAGDGKTEPSSKRRSWEVRAALVRKLERPAKAGNPPAAAAASKAA